MLILIPLCAFLINLCTFAYMRSGGVLYMELIRQFHCTYAEASLPTVLVGSFASFSIFVSGFMTHYFVERSIILTGILLSATSIGLSAFATSIRTIILLSAIQGIGKGLFFGLLLIIISEYFDKGRSFACGLSYSGCTLSAFIFPPLVQFIIRNYDLKMAFATLSLFCYFATFFAWPLKSLKHETVDTFDRTASAEIESHFFQKLTDDLKVLNLLSFWAITVFIYVFLIFIIILPDLASSRGLDDLTAAVMVSIYSIGDPVGRLVPGYMNLKNIVLNQTLYFYSIIIMACLFALVKIYAISFLPFSILCVCLGVVTGIQMTLPGLFDRT